MKKTFCASVCAIMLSTLLIPIRTEAVSYQRDSDTLAAPSVFKLPGRTQDQFAVEPFILGHSAALYELQKKHPSLSRMALKETYHRQLAAEGKIDPAWPDIMEMIHWDFVRKGYFPFTVDGQSFVIRFLNPAKPDKDLERNILFAGSLSNELSYEVIDTFNKMLFLQNIFDNKLETLKEDFARLLNTVAFNAEENLDTASVGFSVLLRLAPARAQTLFIKDLDETQKRTLAAVLSFSEIAFLEGAMRAAGDTSFQSLFASLIPQEDFDSVSKQADSAANLIRAESEGHVLRVDAGVHNGTIRHFIRLDEAEDYVLEKTGPDSAEKRGLIVFGYRHPALDTAAALSRRIAQGKEHVHPALARINKFSFARFPQDINAFTLLLENILADLDNAGGNILFIDFDELAALFDLRKPENLLKIEALLSALKRVPDLPVFGEISAQAHPILSAIAGFNEAFPERSTPVSAREMEDFIGFFAQSLPLTLEADALTPLLDALLIDNTAVSAQEFNNILTAVKATADRLKAEGKETLGASDINTALAGLSVMAKTRHGDPDLTPGEAIQIDTLLNDADYTVLGSQSQADGLKGLLESAIAAIKTGHSKYKRLGHILASDIAVRVVTGEAGSSPAFNVTDARGVRKPVYAYTKGNVIYVTEAFVTSSIESFPEAFIQLMVHELTEIDGGSHEDAERAELKFGTISGKISFLDAFIEMMESGRTGLMNTLQVRLARFGKRFGRLTAEGLDLLVKETIDTGAFTKHYLSERGLTKVPLMIGTSGMSKLKRGWENARYAVVVPQDSLRAIGLAVEYPDGTFQVLTKYPKVASPAQIAEFNALTSLYIDQESLSPFKRRAQDYEEVPDGARIEGQGTSTDTKTGAWAKKVPVLDASKCNECAKCAITCAENAISIVPGKGVLINYDFCKGCDACAVECDTRFALSIVPKQQVKAATASVFSGIYGKKIEIYGDQPSSEAQFFIGQIEQGRLTENAPNEEGYQIVYQDLDAEKSLSGKHVLQVLYRPSDLPAGKRPLLYTFIRADGENWTKITRPQTTMLVYGMTEYDLELAARMQADGFIVLAVPSTTETAWNSERAAFEKAQVLPVLQVTRDDVITSLVDSLTKGKEALATAPAPTLENVLERLGGQIDGVVTAQFENLNSEQFQLARRQAGTVIAPFQDTKTPDISLNEIIEDVEAQMPTFLDSLAEDNPGLTKRLLRHQKDILRGHRACAGCPIYRTFDTALKAVRDMNGQVKRDDFLSLGVSPRAVQIIWKALIQKGYLDKEGLIQHSFMDLIETSKRTGRSPRELMNLSISVKDLPPSPSAGDSFLGQFGSMTDDKLNDVIFSVLSFGVFEIMNSGATGCAEVISTIYPDTAWRYFLHTVFGGLGANLEGLDAMYRYLRESGQLQRKYKFFGWAGDGGTYDIGLQALSGFLERGTAENSVYICYDNGAYMNTGIQRSSATFPGAATSTTPAGLVEAGKEQLRKKLTEISAAHPGAYVATASLSNMADYVEKVKKAALHKGPAIIIVYSNCTTGHKTPTGDTIDQAELAVASGSWPLYEVLDGEIRITNLDSAFNPRLSAEQKEAFLASIGEPGKAAKYFNRDGTFRAVEDPAIHEKMIKFKTELYWPRLIDFLKSEGRFKQHFKKDGTLKPESENFFRNVCAANAMEASNLIRRDAVRNGKDFLMNELISHLREKDREERRRQINVVALNNYIDQRSFFDIGEEIKESAQPILDLVRARVHVALPSYEKQIEQLLGLQDRIPRASDKTKIQSEIEALRAALVSRLNTIFQEEWAQKARLDAAMRQQAAEREKQMALARVTDIAGFIEMDPEEQAKNRAVLEALTGGRPLAGKIFASGGDGGVTVAKMFCTNKKDIGLEAKAAPDYGPERRGAPVGSNIQLGGRELRVQASPEKIDFSIVTDPDGSQWKVDDWRNMIDPDAFKGLTQGEFIRKYQEKWKNVQAGGFIILNTRRTPLEARRLYAIPDNIGVYCMDLASVMEKTPPLATAGLMSIVDMALQNRGIEMPADYMEQSYMKTLLKVFDNEKIANSNLAMQKTCRQLTAVSDPGTLPDKKAFRDTLDAAQYQKKPPKGFFTGAQAAVEASRQINPAFNPQFPITPSTGFPEGVAENRSNGLVDTIISRVDSEHSMVIAAVAAAAFGHANAEPDPQAEKAAQTIITTIERIVAEMDFSDEMKSVITDSAALAIGAFLFGRTVETTLAETISNTLGLMGYKKDMTDDAGRKIAAALEELSFENVTAPQTAHALFRKTGRANRGVHFATSSQGVLLSKEGWLLAASLRLPIVGHIVNRGTNAPLNIHCEHTDIYQVRDDGWVILFARNAQEVYDYTIMAQKIAEELSLPVAVCQDGFIVSHTIDSVDTLADRAVTEFLGEYHPDYSMHRDGGTLNPIALQDHHSEHVRKLSDTSQKMPEIISGIFARFSETSKRPYSLLNEYRIKENGKPADVVVVCMGSTEGTAMEAVDQLRAQGIHAGLLAVKSFRPFMDEDIARALEGVKTVVVMDRANSLGRPLTPLATEVQAAIKRDVLNLEYGRGGRNTPLDLVKDIYRLGLLLGTHQDATAEEIDSLKASVQKMLNEDKDLIALIEELSFIKNEDFMVKFVAYLLDGNFLRAFGPWEHIDVRERSKEREIKREIIEIITEGLNKETKSPDAAPVPSAENALPGIGVTAASLRSRGLEIDPAAFRDFTHLARALNVDETTIEQDIFYTQSLSRAARDEQDRKVISVDLDLLMMIDEHGEPVVRDFAHKYHEYRRKLKAIKNAAGDVVYDIVLFSRHENTQGILNQILFTAADFDRVYTLDDVAALNEGERKESDIAPDVVKLIENDYGAAGVSNDEKDILLIYRDENRRVYGTEDVLRDILHLVSAAPEEGSAESLAQLLSLASDILANDGAISEELKAVITEAEMALPEMLEDGFRVAPVAYDQHYFTTLQRTRAAVARAA